MVLKIKDLEKFARATFPFVNKTELALLFHDFGFDRVSTNFENTASLMLQNRNFAYKYGLLVRKAMEGREFKQALRLGQFDYMTGVDASTVLQQAKGVSEGNTPTPQPGGKSSGGGALGWFNSIIDLIGAGTKAYDTVKGTSASNAEASRLLAEAELARQQSRSNMGLILGIAGAVIVLVVVIIMMRR